MIKQGATYTTIETYDALGRALTETKVNGSGVTQSSVANSYDLDGNNLTTATSYASSPSVVVTRTFDVLDRLATLNDGTRAFTYDSNGNVTAMSVRDPSGQTAVTSASDGYDGGIRLTQQTDTAGPSSTQVHTYAYTYTNGGDRASYSADGAQTTYTYDQSHQLLSEANTAGTIYYTYDGYHNRLTMTTSAGKASYSYDAATHTELTSRTDASGKVTSYAYDPSGNLTQATYDPTGVNQITRYGYDTSNRLNSVTEPNGTLVSFGYDANGQRTSVTVTPSGGSATTVKDYYQLGHLAYQTDGNGVLLASYTYDSQGAPVSVVAGTDPTNAAARYYYVYNSHGDVVNLVDGSGAIAATYAYDTWGALTSGSESLPGGWSNPYRYDGRDGVRYDAASGLYWMSVRAYDPSVGRFISHDPLGRAPLFLADNPYVYAGNNPVSNVDPSGQRPFGGPYPKPVPAPTPTTVHPKSGSPSKRHQAQCSCSGRGMPEWLSNMLLGLNVSFLVTGFEQARELDNATLARSLASHLAARALANIARNGMSPGADTALESATRGWSAAFDAFKSIDRLSP